MMVDDLDEDVIFENSPLYQHLREAGVEGIDAEPVRINGKSTRQTEQEQAPVPPAVSRVSQICRKCFNFLYTLLRKHKHQTDTEVQRYKDQVLSTLRSSRVLVEDDQVFLQDFVGEEPAPPDSRRPSTSHRLWVKLIFPSVLVPCMVAYIAARLTDSGSPYSVTSDLVAGAVAVLGVVYGVVQGVEYRRRRQYDRLYNMFTRCLDTFLSLLTVTRKSLRLIQETELVARGFTLVSQKTAVSQLDRKPSAATRRQCPQLRKCLFATSRAATLVLRQTTLKLIHRHPLIPEIDSISHYLAGIALEDYGPCLQSPQDEENSGPCLQSPQDEEDRGDKEERVLYHLTDGYSVAALKAMTELFHLHLSEFVRRLALCFSQNSQPTDGDGSNPFDTIDLTSDLGRTLQTKELSLRRLYDFHRSSPQGRQPKGRSPQNKCSSQTEEFYIAVHSLDLHLQATISRVRDLASQLESRLEDVPTNQQSESEHAANEKWVSFMAGIKAELEACKGCWDEGTSRLEKARKQVPKLEVPPDVALLKSESRVIPFAEIGDPIIEDQVFEAYTDPDEVEPGSWSWEPILSPEEREKKKREKQEALRLLTELKSVISVRAQDREKREQIALSKMGQGKTTPAGHNDEPTTETSGNVTKNITQSAEQNSCHTSILYGRDDLKSVCGQSPRVHRRGDNSDTIENNRSTVDVDDRCDDTEVGESMFSELKKDRYSFAGAECLDSSTESHRHLCEGRMSKCLPSGGDDQSKPEAPSGGDDQSKPQAPSGDEDQSKPEAPSGDEDQSKCEAPSGSDDEQSDTASYGKDYAPVERDDLKERLERIHGTNLGFTANVAAMAAARSALLRRSEQTFGDTFGDSSEEEEGIVG
ncbi:vezatin-like isoform X2 [Haliotis rufescens]|uniref:vezatin-like isoform X2 n=1 Tax=Haliotis rufescens TaxID=6454 RepID=UPI00201F73EB|nr:vezatin-like isoform X2 [Haliotis rufescens]